MATAIRQPAVAGRFYPANAERLRAEVETFLSPPLDPDVEPESKDSRVGLRRSARRIHVFRTRGRCRVSSNLTFRSGRSFSVQITPAWESRWPS